MLEMRMIFWVTVAITVLNGAASGVLTVSRHPFDQSLLVFRPNVGRVPDIAGQSRPFHS